ncbi:MAG: T9SS type A sorting domain-containing protein [Salibacteraceae bacterium]
MKIRLLTITASLAIAGGSWMGYTHLQQTSAEATYAPVDRIDSKAQNWTAAEENYRAIRANQHTGEIKNEWVVKAEKEVARMSTTGSRDATLVWEEMGPDNVGGRTRAILIDPTNSNRMYAGGAGGGLFVSDNAGGQWRPVNDLAPTALISCIAYAPNGDLYVGTGNSFEGSSEGPGKGVYKSTDGGTTFALIPSTIPTNDNSNTNATAWIKVNDITVDPNNANNVFAATNTGLRVSTDGGTNWINPVYIDPNCSIPATGTAGDLEWSNNGRLLLVLGGGVFYSDNPTDDCSYTKVDGTVLPGSSGRMVISAAPSNKDKIYAMTSMGGQLGNIFVSNDNADTWSALSPGPPLTDPDFNLCGDNGQCVYDLCLTVDPIADERIFIGGVQLYRYDGNWTRAAGEFLSIFSPFYVHSDKHFFTWDPNNSNILYIGHDGGISKSTDRGVTFFTANRGYNVTQFYGIDANTDGIVMGGTQDNGTKAIDETVAGQSKDAFDLTGGDGFDCQFSYINDAIFTTVQFGDVRRSNGFGANFAPIDPLAGEGNAPFFSTIRLWENENDLTSKDSIEFENDTNNLSLGTGDGTRRNFTGSFTPIQSSGDIISGSLIIEAGTSVLIDNNSDGTIDPVSDGTGTITYNTDGSVDYDVTFDNAPNLNLIVEVRFAVEFSAGDTLNFPSATSNLPIVYVLPSNLAHGDIIQVQDPYQSILVSASNSGVRFTRDGLKFSETPEWINITSTVPNFGTSTCFEFSNDGDILYAGTRNGSIYRISGLNDIYELSDPAPAIQQIFTGSQSITGISIHPTNPQILAFTRANWGNTEYVGMIDDAATRTTTANVNTAGVSRQGNLPAMPAYDIQIDVNDPAIAVVGTAYGVFSTENIFAPTVDWVSQTSTIANVEIHAVTQQRLPFNKAGNHDVYYLGTHGRGIWRSGSLVSTPEIPTIADGQGFEANLTVYPNPMINTGFAGIKVNESSIGQMRVFNLQGQMVESQQINLVSGTNNIPMDVTNYPVGTYMVTLETNGETKISKMVVSH